MEKKRIAVWLDHSKAHIVVDEPAYAEIHTIFSEQAEQERFRGETSDVTNWGSFSSNNENRRQQKEQTKILDYYHNLENILLPYDEILLFGPTTAKNELRNILSKNKLFHEKDVHVESFKEVTERQLRAFVRNYFSPMPGRT